LFAKVHTLNNMIFQHKLTCVELLISTRLKKVNLFGGYYTLSSFVFSSILNSLYAGE